MSETNKVKFGLKNVHYAVITVGDDGKVSFATPVRIPGAVNLSMDAAGEQTKFYADDMAYYVSDTNDGYSGNLEVAQIPDSFRKDVLCEELDESAKVLTENAEKEHKPFALLFEFDGDKKATRHVMYNCAAGRPAVSSGTRSNTKEPVTESMSLTASPLASGLVKAKTTAETTVETYDSWYTKVWQPAAE